MTLIPQTNLELEEWLSRPTPQLREKLATLNGDLVILGAGGKMGPTLARMARRALPDTQRVIAVSRFSDCSVADELQSQGVLVEHCDLLNREEVAQLPDAPHVIFMAGQKFGTSDQPELTWIMNAVLPSIVAERYRDSRIVVFSTGCVYPFVDVGGCGSFETDRLEPPGEYANSCVARERVFTHYAKKYQTPLLIYRLNYAIDLRYGVLRDLADKIVAREPIDLSMGHVNIIWQGDANARALQCLSRASTPSEVLNVTGSETLSVRELAQQLGEHLEVEPVFTGAEAPTAWLSNASKSIEWFGEPTVSLPEMLTATAAWVKQGGASLNKPTHFQTRDGNY